MTKSYTSRDVHVASFSSVMLDPSDCCRLSILENQVLQKTNDGKEKNETHGILQNRFCMKGTESCLDAWDATMTANCKAS